MRITLAVAVACLTFGGLAAAGDAKAAIRKDTHIPAEGLGPALTKLAKEFDFQVLYRSEIVSDLKSPGAMGALTSDEALGKVLTGTGLTYKYLDDKTVTIIPVSTGGSGQSTPANASVSPNDANTSKEAGKKTSQGFRLAQLDQGKGSSASSVGAQNSPSTGLTEIVVTAQKRVQRLQDVPIPVSVVNTNALAENDQPLLRDYFDNVPGLSVSPAGGSGNQQMLAIRGISSGAYGNPTVGVTVDGVPYGSFTRELTPDIDPSDLARIEILRGPQGTLFGASTMGGLINFVTVDPSTDGYHGRVEAGLSDVSNGAELGYDFRGAINVPLSETLAIRASAFFRQDAGYIDNPKLHINGLNEDHASGGRLSALWRLSDTFSLKLSALYQDTKSDGLDEADLPTAGYPATASLGELQQIYVRGVGPWEKQFQADSAILAGKVGSVDLTSVSGYTVYHGTSSLDATSSVGALAQKFFGVSGAGLTADISTDKFTQEIRASLPIGNSLEWLVGGFYSSENTPASFDYVALDPVKGTVAGSFFYESIPIQLTEYAAFTDLTVHITDRFDVQLGGRESHLEQDFKTVNEEGLLTGGHNIVIPTVYSAPNVFTYLVTPEFKVSSDLMIYARVASGYRPSRSNAADTNPLVPRTSSPDTTKNYEIGSKGDILDHLLSFDASLYYIDWKDIQINLNDPKNNQGYYINGSRAKSEGAELSVTARPLTGLTVAAWATYDDAVLTQGMPANSAVYGPAGSRLPYSSRFSGNFSLNQDFSITSGVTGFAGGALSYVGDRTGTFVATPQRAYYPAYAKLDLRSGVKFGSWQVNFFANNVADRRGVIGGGAGTAPAYAYYYIQPRTVGLGVVKQF